ncbi:MAG TPA: hypothetical protein VN758_00515 [Solirubrobacterales bacterium]|nr:hypothetical protein [Solirubrobacterales bacterium]
MKTWRSQRVLPHDRELLLGVYVDGRAVDQRGIISRCRYSLMMPDLALEVRSCGNTRLMIRYVGRTRFMVKFKLGSY